MTNKRNLVMGIFLSLLIITLMTFSLTYARYTDELQSDGEISGDIEYIVSNQIEVDSVNSFISAIENGYTNIKISDDVDNPLVITGGVSDVNSDLTIDLNGHELQRNNRDPVLNVTDGVRLTIKDSKGGGCFYNPVGSALRVSGGTLTVTSGIFESGPRTGHGYEGTSGFVENNRYAGEYVTGNTSAAGATISSDLEDVTYYTPNVSGGYSETSSTMPIITPKVQDKVTENNEKRFRINGNMYFENDYSSDASEPTIPADTYLYYTISGANVENTNMAATDKSADFYYTYYVEQKADGTVTYAGTTEGADTLLVTIYGYTGVKKEAEKSTSNFAAIQMEDGYLDVQGGRYTAYFGKGETNCVYASGGLMTVMNAEFEALDESVCVNIAYKADVNTQNEYLRVDSGNFYSEIGDTINVSGGLMTVNAGTFTKDASKNSSEATTAGENNAAIHVSGGQLTVNSGTFSLTGYGLYGIHVDASQGTTSTFAEGDMATISNAAFSFKAEGKYNYAIYSNNGKLSTTGTEFNFIGESTNNRGIYVSGANAAATVTGGSFNYQGGGSDNYGIYSENGGVVTNGVAFTFGSAEGTEYCSNGRGIYVTGSTASATVTDGSFTFYNGGTGNRGIWVSQGSVVTKMTAAAESMAFTFNGCSSSYGIYSEDGGSVETSSPAFTFAGDGSNNTGIYSAGGAVTVANGNFDFNTGSGQGSENKGIHSAGGSVTVNEGSFAFNAVNDSTTSGYSQFNYGIYSETNNGQAGSIICNSITIAINSTYSAGILAYGGTTTINGTFSCTVNDPSNTLSSTAISTEGGTINLNATKDASKSYMIETDGLGITSRVGGTITISKELSINSEYGTAIYMSGGTLTIGENAKADITSVIDATKTWVTPPGVTGDPNTEIYNGIYIEGGSLLSYGTLNVTHTGVANDDTWGGDLIYQQQPIKSYAVRVTSSNANQSNVVIYAGMISNIIGGGVYAGGGTVTLGYGTNGPTVTTSGTEMHNTVHYNNTDNWRYYLTSTGGHAVEVNGGDLTVYGGSYSAQQGNGIFVRNLDSSSKSTVDIHNGTFLGYSIGQYNKRNSRILGPAASTGLNVIGGGTVTIRNGTFGSMYQSSARDTNSGASVMGLSGQQAVVNIYGGNFYAYNCDAFSVFLNVTVNFGSQGQTGTINVNSTSAAILSVQESLGNGNAPEINIYYGAFGGINTTASFGIYYGNGDATLNIHGGTFYGIENAMRINAFPDSRIQLSAGTFINNGSDQAILNNTNRKLNYTNQNNGYRAHLLADGATAYGSDNINAQGTNEPTGNINDNTNDFRRIDIVS